MADGEKITMLTAYDACIAPLLEAAGVDVLLVGDSIGNVSLGYSSTLPVSLDDIVRATGSVSRSTSRSFILADLPFGSFEANNTQAFEAASALMVAGAGGVKIEGGEHRAEVIRFLTQNGIPVMGHLGYTPQSEHTLGGPRLQGRGEAKEQLLRDALAIEEAGAFGIVLEMVPANIAAKITQSVAVPTIGIGAGPDCDGQVLVWADMAGMTDWTPSFVRRFAELGKELQNAAGDYVSSTKDGSFPGSDNYKLD